MGKVQFYALWSLREVPRQFISKSNRLCYQLQLPLPLPKQLVIFSLGDWNSFSRETTISAEVWISQDLMPQKLGFLSSQSRCLIWEGAWRLDLLTETIEKAEKGVYGKVLLTVCGEVKASFTSSTPMLSRKRLASDWLSGRQEDPFPNMHHSRGNQDKTPRRTVIGTRGQLTWSSEELCSSQDSTLTSSSKKRKMRLVSVTQSDEEKPVVKLKKKCRAVCPSKRWSQTMCLSDPETAILIGGEVTGHSHCKDSFWKLEIGVEPQHLSM
ncbi:hypothetical protein JZ751_002801 [Albula glossodonta]|uniref:Uncharacterized protein n=1 Tax=Albula glossodonta TaxID=121402 RepID=A0A8T2N927_9TELE|nr:hypothetical protein JZ751_002801 [Albula glossodonta]